MRAAQFLVFLAVSLQSLADFIGLLVRLNVSDLEEGGVNKCLYSKVPGTLSTI